MRTRTIAAVLATGALTLAACSSSGDDDKDTSPKAASAASGKAAEGHYTSAQDVADALAAAGFTVSEPRKDTDSAYIAEVGGTAYDFTVTDRAKAAGDAGINIFPNPETLKAWIPLSKSFGGVAVTGGTWAVSLPTTTPAAHADSKRLAPKVADALDGTVQQ
ncbi:hypothetical protein ACIQU5_17765 [Streptomyces sp. NPDC090306]|uniref:hypothetical protein n=1 Tax=Streptomyces sp. NPDC090306 TaxID=3365961 RepID=UPI00382E0682